MTLPFSHPYAYQDHLPADFADRSLRADVIAGLTAPAKWLPPKWFYDKVGSELFEDITRLPEYYPTRSERAILAERAVEIVALAGTRTLVELGSGSSEKTRLLLDAMLDEPAGASRPAAGGGPDGRDRPGYVALDVSEDALRQACSGLVAQYPQLRIEAVRAEFTQQLDVLPDGAGRTVAFLGGTIGNFEPAARAAFLSDLRRTLRPGDHLLLGADLVKSPQILVPAYDDAAGVTAAFNLNVLDVLNHRLGAGFRRSDFTHVAVWDPEHEWIEMRLRAGREITTRIEDVGLTVRLAAGEEIRTEISAKFRRDGLTAELAAAGFAGRGWWTDERGWFSLSLWTVR
ncbi:L-histidine N(alpha)-methyltransferase [Nakamurella sp.]|uniref:L-histidine N(alpha)-methyltransferase n=1 Tax=Nakamurella sp. TaxID=1869182 RepID=UPI003B3AEDAF